MRHPRLPPSRFPRRSGLRRSSRRARPRRAEETPSPGVGSWHRFHSDSSDSGRINRRCYPISTARADTGPGGRRRRSFARTTRNGWDRSRCPRRCRRSPGGPSYSGRGKSRHCTRACRSGFRGIGDRSSRNSPRCSEGECTPRSTDWPRHCTRTCTCLPSIGVTRCSARCTPGRMRRNSTCLCRGRRTNPNSSRVRRRTRHRPCTRRLHRPGRRHTACRNFRSARGRRARRYKSRRSPCSRRCSGHCTSPRHRVSNHWRSARMRCCSVRNGPSGSARRRTCRRKP
jgi:hypothetical protein